MKNKIGLIVNPIAGMGGSVGLKGTDGAMQKQALALGAKPVTPQKTKDVLSRIENIDKIELVVAAGSMGEEYAEHYSQIIGEHREETSSDDTQAIAKKMIEHGIDLLIFVGGDGTARDIYDAIGLEIPVVAVPAGVKVFSAVFAVSPRAAAEMVDAFLEGTEVQEQEVLDIDEQAFQNDRLASQLYGYLLVPQKRGLLQRGKEQSSTTKSSQQSKQAIATYIASVLKKDTLILLGPGTTIKAIADEIGVGKTLLGVDAVVNRKCVGTDLNEKAILALIAEYPETNIIVTPIGGNGFIFGRGNKQFTEDVLKRVGADNIIIVSTRDKLLSLESLRVDTGDVALDEELAGYRSVIVGHNETVKMEVKC